MKWTKFWVREDGKEYDEAKRRSAGQRAVIYYLVAVYIGYMGYSILKNRLTGDSPMSYPVAIIIVSVFILSAVGIIFYATNWLRKEFVNSVIDDTKK